MGWRPRKIFLYFNLRTLVLINLMVILLSPGGKIIQGIQKDTNTTITIEELETGEGRVQIMSNNADDMNAANARIRMIAFPPTVDEGMEYEGKVKAVKDFGCFVEILPGTDGLIHISEFSWEKVAKMEDVCKEGDVLKVKMNYEENTYTITDE
jgi:polyribonucleotide nucleotidyltransferase